MKPTQISDWAVVFRPEERYDAPELRRQYLNGAVRNHPVQADGKWVTTSAIVGKQDGMVLTESGTLYQLGGVRADYEKQFPNAAERLLGTLPEKNASVSASAARTVTA